MYGSSPNGLHHITNGTGSLHLDTSLPDTVRVTVLDPHYQMSASLTVSRDDLAALVASLAARGII